MRNLVTGGTGLLGRLASLVDAGHDVRVFARDLSAVGDLLAHGAEALRGDLRDRGNGVAASIPLALAEAAHTEGIERGDRVLLVGTGAGLTLGALTTTH
jgi:3-oxoacyl-[acyl-carrier-protein] synthase III